MKKQPSLPILVLATLTLATMTLATVTLSASPAAAQLVSSHAPSAAAQPPASSTSSSSSMMGATAPQPVGKPVARVNGAVLTDLDLVREEYTIFPYARQHNGMIPTAMEPDIRVGAMRMIVFEELVYQEAVRRKMSVTPERLARSERQFRKQFSNPQEYDALLKSQFKGSEKLLQAKIARSLLIDDLLKLEVLDKSAVPLAEARAFYDKNPERFRYAESYSIQSISIIPPENANPAQQQEARKRADNALRQAQQTKTSEEFGLLAEKISEDDFRVMMGDHHSVEGSKLPPAILQPLSKLQPGQISGLIELDNHAYTILRLNAHIPAGQKPFDEVKDALREQLKRQKTEDLRKTLDARLRKHAKVEEL